MLEITNLHATVAGKPILNGVSLHVPAGEVHAIMGPNGAGKSTLAYVLAGRPGYEVTEGSVTFSPVTARESGGRAACTVCADTGTRIPRSRERRAGGPARPRPARARRGGAVPRLPVSGRNPRRPYLQFLRESLNAQRRARGEAELSGAEFIKLARSQAALLGMDAEMLKRPVNVGFSGGEKKRAEMVQMGIMQPRFAVLDETDSGLDIDALQSRRRGHQPHHARAGQGRAADHPLPAPARLCRARPRPRARPGGSSAAAARTRPQLEREGYAEAAA